MAQRPVFVPRSEGRILVETLVVDFAWYAGMAVSQKQKSIRALHEAAKEVLGIERILEVSTKSPDKNGAALSAFRLAYRPRGSDLGFPVEVLFQSSKVFKKGGPYLDLRKKGPAEAKRDPRLQESGELMCFESGGHRWDLEPRTAFYDWIYLNVLNGNQDLADVIENYEGFTDIEFNPKKSINCQAYAVSLFASLKKRGLIERALGSQSDFLDVMSEFETGDTQRDSRGSRRML